MSQHTFIARVRRVKDGRCVCVCGRGGGSEGAANNIWGKVTAEDQSLLEKAGGFRVVLFTENTFGESLRAYILFLNIFFILFCEQ